MPAPIIIETPINVLGVGTLLNPLVGPRKKFTLIKDAFFPPAEMAESKPNTDGEDVSSSASYEEEEDSTVIIDDGGGQQSSPAPSQSSPLPKLRPTHRTAEERNGVPQNT